MSGGKSKLIGAIFCSIFWMLMGVALSAGSFLIPAIQDEPHLKWVVLALGVLMVILSIVCIAVFSAKIKKIPSQKILKAKSSVAKQTSEQKLAQMDLMEYMQFVVYVSRLFQSKGYTVDFAPVDSDGGVSFVAEMNGKSFAVICILSSNAVSDSVVMDVCADWKKYSCQTAMLVTNAYLDRSARRFARKNKICVVNRSKLVKEYF